MARKFINRQEKKGLDAKKAVSAEDEWANIGGDIKEVDTKIETKKTHNVVFRFPGFCEISATSGSARGI